MIEGRATARYVRTSAQKAGLVLDLIRGHDVNRALATLRFAKKKVARDITKVLLSAISNVQQNNDSSADVDRLYVGDCFANQGPTLKRIRPAPMGRTFRIAKRTSHLTVTVRERPELATVVSGVTDEREEIAEKQSSSDLSVTVKSQKAVSDKDKKSTPKRSLRKKRKRRTS